MKEQALKKRGFEKDDKGFFKFADSMPKLSDKRAELDEDDGALADGADDDEQFKSEAEARARREYDAEQLALKREIYGEAYDASKSDEQNRALLAAKRAADEAAAEAAAEAERRAEEERTGKHVFRANKTNKKKKKKNAADDAAQPSTAPPAKKQRAKLVALSFDEPDDDDDDDDDDE
jgi:hypothetical protein